MTASPERVGKTKARAFCGVCQDGINGVGWTKAVNWCEAHNAANHLTPRPAPGDPDGVNMDHAPGAAKLPSDNA